MVSSTAREAEIARIAASNEARTALERHLEEVIESAAFKGSHRSQLFLRHVVHQAIAGHFEALKERTIGMDLFGRSPSYATGEDAIVRVTANDVRKRLLQHYGKYGPESTFRINLPLGSYIPEITGEFQSAACLVDSGKVQRFPPASLEEAPAQQDSECSSMVARESAPAAETPSPLHGEGIAPADEIAAHGMPAARRWRRTWLLVTTLVLIALSISVVMIRNSWRRASRSTASISTDPILDFWGQFFNKPNKELKIVYADTSFALWQDLNGLNLNLGDYLNRKYLDPKDKKLFNVTMRRVTSPADMAIAVQISALAGRFGGQVNTRFARDTSIEYLRDGNLVLMGSHRSNPWVEVYEPELNFVLQQDRQTGAPLFQNRAPRPGEARVYGIPAMFDTQKVEERAYLSYAVVALLKNCRGGLTVLAEGLNSQATQAGGDLITDPQRIGSLLNSIGHKPGTNVAPFEALIEVRSLPGEYENSKVIAYRLLPAQSCAGD